MDVSCLIMPFISSHAGCSFKFILIVVKYEVVVEKHLFSSNLTICILVHQLTILLKVVGSARIGSNFLSGSFQCFGTNHLSYVIVGSLVRADKLGIYIKISYF